MQHREKLKMEANFFFDFLTIFDVNGNLVICFRSKNARVAVLTDTYEELERNEAF